MVTTSVDASDPRAPLEGDGDLRVLGPRDLPAVRELVRRDPVLNVLVDHRVEATRLDPRWFGGEMWGWYESGELVSLCHAGTNLIVVESTPAALEAFGARAARSPRRASCVAGRREDVEAMWHRLEPAWGRARSLRLDQPFLVLDSAPTVAPDPRVRAVLIDEVDVVYPACVAMYREELGESPEVPNAQAYRARVAQTVTRGWAYAVIEDGRVLFKAEIGAATTRACQVQGVYVDPSVRGRGLAAPAMAAVVELARRHVAPVVTLYVNHHNVAARRAYARAGFRQTETYASVLF